MLLLDDRILHGTNSASRITNKDLILISIEICIIFQGRAVLFDFYYIPRQERFCRVGQPLRLLWTCLHQDSLQTHRAAALPDWSKRSSRYLRTWCVSLPNPGERKRRSSEEERDIIWNRMHRCDSHYVVLLLFLHITLSVLPLLPWEFWLHCSPKSQHRAGDILCWPPCPGRGKELASISWASDLGPLMTRQAWRQTAKTIWKQLWMHASHICWI